MAACCPLRVGTLNGAARRPARTDRGLLLQQVHKPPTVIRVPPPGSDFPERAWLKALNKDGHALYSLSYVHSSGEALCHYYVRKILGGITLVGEARPCGSKWWPRQRANIWSGGRRLLRWFPV